MQHLGFEHWGSKLELPSVSSILAQMRRYIPSVHMRGERTRYFTVFFFQSRALGDMRAPRTT